MSDSAPLLPRAPAASLAERLDAYVGNLDEFLAGLDGLTARELSTLNCKVLALVNERQKRVQDPRAALAAVPYLMAIAVSEALVGRLIDDPVSWQRVERLMRALGDTDREKLLLSIEKRRGWAVRRATADRWVGEAKRRGPKKSADRLELLAFAQALKSETDQTWAEILPRVNEIARELGIKNGGADDVDLYDSVVNLRTAVNKERKNPAFVRDLEQFKQLINEPDDSQNLVPPAA